MEIGAMVRDRSHWDFESRHSSRPSVTTNRGSAHNVRLTPRRPSLQETALSTVRWELLTFEFDDSSWTSPGFVGYFFRKGCSSLKWLNQLKDEVGIKRFSSFLFTSALKKRSSLQGLPKCPSQRRLSNSCTSREDYRSEPNPPFPEWSSHGADRHKVYNVLALDARLIVCLHRPSDLPCAD